MTMWAHQPGGTFDVKLQGLQVREGGTVNAVVVKELELGHDVFGLKVMERKFTPTPFKMEDIGVEFDGEIGGHQMVFEMSSASGGEIELVITFDQIDFRRRTVATIDGGRLGGGGVGEKPVVEELMNNFAGSMNF